MGLSKLALVAMCLAPAASASAGDMVVRATWYGSPYHGRLMANGQPFNMWDETTVASRDLRRGTRIRVTNPKNGRSLVAVVRDKSPYSPLDCSYAGAVALGFAQAGRATLRVAIIH